RGCARAAPTAGGGSWPQLGAGELEKQVLEVGGPDAQVGERHLGRQQCAQRAFEVIGGDLDAVVGLQDVQRQRACLRREVLARQLQQQLGEVLVQQAARRSLGDDAAAVHDDDVVAQ